MQHVAIMKKSWGLTRKILSGEKKIESRWYRFKHAPWDRINKGDDIYFKDSGEPVTIKAKVSKVLQFDDLDNKGISEILNKYYRKDGIDKKDLTKYIEMFKDKKYCILVFLEDARKVIPFEINKKGFGAMAAWITVENVKSVRMEI